MHRRTTTRVVLLGHALNTCPGRRQYVWSGLGGQWDRDQVCLDVRTEPKPIINQPAMPAVIAPASVASIGASAEVLRAEGRSLDSGAVTGASLWAGRMTRIWLDAGASNRSVCTSTPAVGDA